MSRLTILTANCSCSLDCSLLGYLNDVWRYQRNDSTWTWISGNNTRNEPGFYGEKGNAKADNYPGSRASALAFYDSPAHKLILFGGHGYDSVVLGP